MSTIRNPRVWKPSILSPGEMMLNSNAELRAHGYVSFADYEELLRKYDARGKQLTRFRLKINRLLWVITSHMRR